VGGIIGGVVALLVGGALATATIVGIVSSETSKNEKSLSPSSQVLDYGSNQ
jgi:hypothetical protein